MPQATAAQSRPRSRRTSESSITSACTFGPGTQLGIQHPSKVAVNRTSTSTNGVESAPSVDSSEFELLSTTSTTGSTTSNSSTTSLFSKESQRSTTSSSNGTLRGIRSTPIGTRGAFGEALERNKPPGSAAGRKGRSRSSSASSQSTAVARTVSSNGKTPRVAVSFALAPTVVPGDVPFADGMRAPSRLHGGAATGKTDGVYANQLALKVCCCLLLR